MPILVGRENAIKILAVAFLISYLWILALILFADLSPWLLVVFLSSPKAYQAVKKFIGKTIPIEMMPAMKATAQTNTYFGFLLSIGFIISYLF